MGAKGRTGGTQGCIGGRKRTGGDDMAPNANYRETSTVASLLAAWNRDEIRAMWVQHWAGNTQFSRSDTERAETRPELTSHLRTNLAWTGQTCPWSEVVRGQSTRLNPADRSSAAELLAGILAGEGGARGTPGSGPAPMPISAGV